METNENTIHANKSNGRIDCVDRLLELFSVLLGTTTKIC